MQLPPKQEVHHTWMYVSIFSIRAFFASSCGVPGSTLLTCTAIMGEHSMHQRGFLTA